MTGNWSDFLQKNFRFDRSESGPHAQRRQRDHRHLRNHWHRLDRSGARQGREHDHGAQAVQPDQWGLPGQSRATACGEACQIHAYAIARRNRANSTPYGARSVKRLPAFQRGGGLCDRAAHCSSRAVWFQWTKVLGVEITGLETRRFEQWHRHWGLPGQSRATACGDACQIHAYAIARRNRANSTPYGARSVKRLPAFQRGGGLCVRAAHCSSRAVWFQWTKVLGVEITGLETRRFEQWHRHWGLPGQSRATFHPSEKTRKRVSPSFRCMPLRPGMNARGIPLHIIGP